MEIPMEDALASFLAEIVWAILSNLPIWVFVEVVLGIIIGTAIQAMLERYAEYRHDKIRALDR